MFDDIKSASGVIFAAIVGGALAITKLLNVYKTDRNTSDILDRVRSLEESNSERDKKIHDYAVRITRLTVVMIRMESMFIAEGKEIPDDLAAEIDELRRGL